MVHYRRSPTSVRQTEEVRCFDFAADLTNLAIRRISLKIPVLIDERYREFQQLSVSLKK
jgi:hypothetical protein